MTLPAALLLAATTWYNPVSWFSPSDGIVSTNADGTVVTVVTNAPKAVVPRAKSPIRRVYGANGRLAALRWEANFPHSNVSLSRVISLGLSDEKKITVYGSNTLKFKGWTRNYVMWDDETDELHDSGGKLRKYSEAERYCRDLDDANRRLEEADASIDRSMDAFYSITNDIPSEVVFISGYEGMRKAAAYSNYWGYISAHYYDHAEGNDYFYVYFNSNITNKPTLAFRYTAVDTTNWVNGYWVDWDQTVEVWDGRTNVTCRAMRVMRPKAFALNAVKVNNWMDFGGEKGFSFNNLNIFVDDVLATTGVFTNGELEVTVDNGGIRNIVRLPEPEEQPPLALRRSKRLAQIRKYRKDIRKEED